MLKICHIINNLMGGGAQNFLFSLAIAQVKLNHNVTIIVIDKDVHDYCKKMKYKLEVNGVKVYYINRKIGNKISYIKSLFICTKFIKHENFDIVNTHLPMPHIFGGFANLFLKSFKHILTIHSSPETWDHVNKILNNKKPLIFCSDASFKFKRQNNPITCIINNGILINNNNNNEIKSEIRQELGLNLNSYLVILVGALRPEKNYFLLSEIAKEFENRNIQFLICGSLTSKVHINASFLQNRKNIHLLGLRSDINQLLKQSDLYMSCSLLEGLPISLLEALFSGISCLLSPILQHKNIIENIDECYIPQTFDVKGFSMILNKLIDRGKVNKSQILESRISKIAKYDIKNTATKYIEFYKKIINIQKHL